MSRTRRRISRALLACLGVTLALGTVAWLHNTNKTKAAATNDAQLPPPPKLSSELRAEENKAKSETVAVKAEQGKAPAKPVAGLVTQTPSITPAVATPTPPVTPSAQNAGTTGVTPAFLEKANTPVSSQPLVDAQAKLDAGQTLEARKILSAALAARKLAPAEATAVKAKLTEINQTVIFSRTLYGDDEFGGNYKVQSGDSFGKIAHRNEVTADLLSRINGIDPRRLQAGKTIKLVKGPMHLVVDKGDFTLDVWIGPPEEPGSMYVKSFKVGLGEDNSTPAGTWIITNKLKNPAYYSPRGEGVFEPEDPKNPLGEYWMGLEGIDGAAVGAQSYGIHGTIEPDTIGKQKSMGCIRLLNEDVGQIYEMVVDGKSTVIVRD